MVLGPLTTGPLSLTSVISHERGEAVKSTFSPNQGSEERVLTKRIISSINIIFLITGIEDYITHKYA